MNEGWLANKNPPKNKLEVLHDVVSKHFKLGELDEFKAKMFFIMKFL